MMALYRHGLNKEVLLKECEEQGRLKGSIDESQFESFLAVKINEMEQKFGISIPWRKELEKIAEIKIGCILVLKELKKGSKTVPQIASELNLPNRQIREYVNYLATKEKIEIQKKSRPYKLSLKE